MMSTRWRHGWATPLKRKGDVVDRRQEECWPFTAQSTREAFAAGTVRAHGRDPGSGDGRAGANGTCGLTMKPSSCLLFLGCWLAGQWRPSAGQLYQKPSISVFPRPEVIQGENVRISCGNALYSRATFYLYKGFSSQPVKVQQPSNSQLYSVEFPISNVQQSDGGSYRCVYCIIAESRNPQCSSASDAVSIVVTAEVYPKPSISVSPGELLTHGENASIRCKSSPQANAEFILRQTVLSETYLTKKTESEEVVFPIGQAKSFHAGMYQCRYCLNSAFYKRCSNYSDKAYINITDPTLSRPSIRIRPKLQVSLGLNATIECQGPECSSPLTFFLFKSGNLIASQKGEPVKNTTQFLLSGVQLEDAGSYSCRYRSIDPFMPSEPSDAVELTVTENAVTATSPVEAKLRLAAAGFLLLLLLLIVSEAAWSWRRGQL